MWHEVACPGPGARRNKETGRCNHRGEEEDHRRRRFNEWACEVVVVVSRVHWWRSGLRWFCCIRSIISCAKKKQTKLKREKMFMHRIKRKIEWRRKEKKKEKKKNTVRQIQLGYLELTVCVTSFTNYKRKEFSKRKIFYFYVVCNDVRLDPRESSTPCLHTSTTLLHVI